MERKFNEQETNKRNKLSKMRSEGVDPFIIQRFEKNGDSQTIKNEYESFTKEELHDKKIPARVAGRVIAIRQTFGVIKDFAGSIQFYINKKNIDEKVWKTFSEYLDLGDIVGIEGWVMKTNTGEITINVSNFIILSKSLKPLPEKFHGLTDEEERSRKRYVDLFVNDKAKDAFVTRSKIISEIRHYMDSLGFYEVETPILHDILGGANARPFVTFHNTLKQSFYLRIAPELHLKRLIVGGFEKVYEIGRIFRNEGMDTTHNPEFTTIEAYWAYVSMEEIMELTENIFHHVAKKLNKQKTTWRTFEVDFSLPFIKKNMVEFIKEETQVDFDKDILNDEQALAIANKFNINVLEHQKTRGHIINLFFEEFCEKKCIQPTFVYGHPVEVSPLAKKNPKDQRYTDRFELFICQKELANAFSELNDPIDQYNRFEEQLKEKDKGNDEASEMDIDFVEALEYAMPPTGGLGIGIDRLVMLFTENDSIRNVLLFPHLKKEL